MAHTATILCPHCTKPVEAHERTAIDKLAKGLIDLEGHCRYAVTTSPLLTSQARTLSVCWDLDNGKAMQGVPSGRVLQLIVELEAEGLL